MRGVSSLYKSTDDIKWTKQSVACIANSLQWKLHASFTQASAQTRERYVRQTACRR